MKNKNNINYILAKYDSIGYALYNRYDIGCRDNMLEALNSVEELFEQHNGAALQDLFNLCHPVDTDAPKEMSFFYEALFEWIIDYVNQFQ